MFITNCYRLDPALKSNNRQISYIQRKEQIHVLRWKSQTHAGLNSISPWVQGMPMETIG